MSSMRVAFSVSRWMRGALQRSWRTWLTVRILFKTTFQRTVSCSRISSTPRAHSARLSCSPFVGRFIQPAVAQSFLHHQLPMFSSCVAPSSKPCRQIRFTQGPQLRSDAQASPRRLYQCSTTETNKQTANCTQNKNTFKRSISVDGVHTASSASEVIDASQSEACRCFT